MEKILGENARPRILLFGDSYGTARRHGDKDDVERADTWPELVSAAYRDRADVISDFQPFRMLTASREEIAAHGACDIIVLMMGIVDSYPRPLPMHLDRSLALPARILRRALRPVRRYWISIVYNRPYAGMQKIDAALAEIERCCGHLVLVTYPAVTPRHAAAIPGAQASLDALSVLMRKRAMEASGRVHLADVAVAARASGRDDLVSVRDSHLTRAGNGFVAAIVNEPLEKILAKVVP